MTVGYLQPRDIATASSRGREAIVAAHTSLRVAAAPNFYIMDGEAMSLSSYERQQRRRCNKWTNADAPPGTAVDGSQ